MDGWTDGRTDRRMDEQMNEILLTIFRSAWFQESLFDFDSCSSTSYSVFPCNGNFLNQHKEGRKTNSLNIYCKRVFELIFTVSSSNVVLDSSAYAQANLVPLISCTAVIIYTYL